MRFRAFVPSFWCRGWALARLLALCSLLSCRFELRFLHVNKEIWVDVLWMTLCLWPPKSVPTTCHDLVRERKKAGNYCAVVFCPFDTLTGTTSASSEPGGKPKTKNTCRGVNSYE